MFRKTMIAIASAAFVLTASTATAQPTATETPVATIVVIKTPPGITRPMLDGGFKQALPVYEKIPGLLRKFFIANEDSFGGMYLWKDRASAEAWYSDAWRAKAKATYGSDPQLTYFDAPLQIDNVAKTAGK